MSCANFNDSGGSCKSDKPDPKCNMVCDGWTTTICLCNYGVTAGIFDNKYYNLLEFTGKPSNIVQNTEDCVLLDNGTCSNKLSLGTYYSLNAPFSYSGHLRLHGSISPQDEQPPIFKFDLKPCDETIRINFNSASDTRLDNNVYIMMTQIRNICQKHLFWNIYIFNNGSCHYPLYSVISVHTSGYQSVLTSTTLREGVYNKLSKRTFYFPKHYNISYPETINIVLGVFYNTNLSLPMQSSRVHSTNYLAPIIITVLETNGCKTLINSKDIGLNFRWVSQQPILEKVIGCPDPIYYDNSYRLEFKCTKNSFLKKWTNNEKFKDYEVITKDDLFLLLTPLLDNIAVEETMVDNITFSFSISNYGINHPEYKGCSNIRFENKPFCYPYLLNTDDVGEKIEGGSNQEFLDFIFKYKHLEE